MWIPPWGRSGKETPPQARSLVSSPVRGVPEMVGSSADVFPPEGLVPSLTFDGLLATPLWPFDSEPVGTMCVRERPPPPRSARRARSPQLRPTGRRSAGQRPRASRRSSPPRSRRSRSTMRLRARWLAARLAAGRRLRREGRAPRRPDELGARRPRARRPAGCPPRARVRDRPSRPPASQRARPRTAARPGAGPPTRAR